MSLARCRYAVVLALFLLCMPFSLQAFTGTEGASFLELPVGARPAALGSAYSMLAEDAYAPVWNPAGLAFLDGIQFGGMHNIYVENTSNEYASLVMPLGRSSGIGGSIQYFSPGTITGLDASGNSIGDVHGSYASYTLAAGHSFGPTLGVGLAGHFVHAQIDDVSGHGFAGSGGLLYRPNTQWRASAVVDNLGNKLTLLQSADSLPTIYRLGVAYHPRPDWTLALEGDKQKDSLASAHMGVEYETPFGFTFRTGYNTERIRELSPAAGVTVGVSMLIWNQDFSYAWLPLGDFGSSHLFSLVWHFGQKNHTEGEDTHQLQRPPPEDETDLMLDNQ